MMKQPTPATLSLVGGRNEDGKTDQRQPDGMMVLFFLAFGLADPLH